MGNRPASAALKKIEQTMAQRARTCAQRSIAQGIGMVPSRTALSALSGVSVGAADMESPRFVEQITAYLKRALLRERLKARTRHSSYDFNRHLALHQALRSLSAAASTG